uniref:RING-type domain-containing protein n=1 Tax=Meloidogyne hapla TaxID=6305 RepID=A0A1I8BVT8_MELHA
MSKSFFFLFLTFIQISPSISMNVGSSSSSCSKSKLMGEIHSREELVNQFSSVSVKEFKIYSECLYLIKNDPPSRHYSNDADKYARCLKFALLNDGEKDDEDLEDKIILMNNWTAIKKLEAFDKICAEKIKTIFREIGKNAEEEMFKIEFAAAKEKAQLVCPICLGEFAQDEHISMNKCGHFFHYKCLKGWYEKGKSKNHKNCPLCQAKIEIVEHPDVIALNEKLGKADLGFNLEIKYLGVGYSFSLSELQNQKSIHEELIQEYSSMSIAE